MCSMPGNGYKICCHSCCLGSKPEVYTAPNAAGLTAQCFIGYDAGFSSLYHRIGNDLVGFTGGFGLALKPSSAGFQ